MSKAFKCFDFAVKVLLCVLCIAMTCVETWQILSRFFFKIPMAWAEEVVRYMFVWITYMAVGVGIDRDGHAKFDLLLKRIPKKAEKWYNTFLMVLMLAIFSVLAIYGVKSAIANSYQLTAATRISYSIVITGVPVGAVVAIIYVIKNLVQIWVKKPTTLEEVNS